MDLVKKYKDKKGRTRVTGNPEALRKSAAYPVGFGYAVSPTLGVIQLALVPH